MRKPYKTVKKPKNKPHTFQLGKFDAAVIVRCKTRTGPIQRQLLLPECDPAPASTGDLLAYAVLIGKSTAAKQVRHIVQKQLELASRIGKGKGRERPAE